MHVVTVVYNGPIDMEDPENLHTGVGSFSRISNNLPPWVSSKCEKRWWECGGEEICMTTEVESGVGG